jgi:hypothetical protein
LSEETKARPVLEDFCIPKENYARSAVFPLWTSSSRTSSYYTNEQIGNLLKDPLLSYRKLRDVSNWLYVNSPAYVNIVDYFSHLLSFDYLIYPAEVQKNKSTVKTRFQEAAKMIRDSSVKEIYPEMLKRTFVNGSTYWYDLGDKTNTIYVEIDSRICQLAMVDDDNIWRFYIDFAYIKQDTYYEMPEEIRNAYDTWIEGGKRKDKEKRVIEGTEIEIQSNLYLVGKRGFTLTSHLEKVKNDYPLLTPMFKDFNSMDDNKGYLNDTLKAEAIKIVHLKIPTDEEGFPLLPKEVIQAYHDSAKEHLPPNVTVVTTPFEIDGVALDKSQSNQTNLVEHSQTVISNDSGISTTVFSTETTNGLSYSTAKDVAKMLPYYYYFTNIANYKIKAQKMQVKFLPHSFHQRSDQHKTYAADLPLGGSRMLWVATSGLEIYDAMKVLEFEQEINIDELLPVKASAAQMSGDDGGRPQKEETEKADSTVKIEQTT